MPSTYGNRPVSDSHDCRDHISQAPACATSPAEQAAAFFAAEPAALTVTLEHRTTLGRLLGWYVITRSGRIVHIGGINDDLSNLEAREALAISTADLAARREVEWVMKTRPADIVFLERDPHWVRVATGRLPLGRWDVKFLSAQGVQGGILGRPASAKHTILTVRETEDGYFEWTTPGENTHNGNRHEVAHDWATVQATILKWAGRRFRVAVES